MKSIDKEDANEREYLQSIDVGIISCSIATFKIITKIYFNNPDV